MRTKTKWTDSEPKNKTLGDFEKKSACSRWLIFIFCINTSGHWELLPPSVTFQFEFIQNTLLFAFLGVVASCYTGHVCDKITYTSLTQEYLLFCPDSFACFLFFLIKWSRYAKQEDSLLLDTKTLGSRKYTVKDPTLIWEFDISNDIWMVEGWVKGNWLTPFLIQYFLHVHFMHQSIPAVPILPGQW